MRPTYDVAVVGLGAVGSAAAYHAAKRSMRVVGFDRFTPPHARGSTHGGSRIIRKAYFEGDVYLPLLKRAYACWRELEEDRSARLLHLQGSLTVAPRGSRVLQGAVQAARGAGIPHEVFDPPALLERFPAFRLREDELALFEPEAGWIDPEEAVRAHLDGAKRCGADLLCEEPVRSWQVDAGGVRVVTAGGAYAVGALIVCSGGWMTSMLADLAMPLTIERQVNVWYRPAKHPDHFRPDRCPVYIWEYEQDGILYGFPDLGPGVKAGLHHAGRPAGRPGEIDRDVHPADVEKLTVRLRRLLPSACGAAARAATCFYTNTPDERFIIDVHPKHPCVVFASACSGHGFKFSSAIGENLALLAAGDTPSVDLRAYRAGRYRGGRRRR